VEICGRTPIDLPSAVEGRFSVVAEGSGVSRTQGVFRFPPRGAAPFSLSEPAGLSAGLLVRSLNFPGVPNVAAKRASRGWPMALAAAGALGLAARAHVRYRDELDKPGADAAIEIREERRVRNAWLIYGGSVWAMSAVDYWMRPRFSVYGATPARLSLGVPTIARGRVVARSMFVPGAGQTFANHRTRGALWLVAALAAGAGFTVGETTLARKRADLEESLLLAGRNPGDPLPYLARAEAAREDIRSAKDLRRSFAYGALAVYAGNLMDALALSLKRPENASGPELSATFGPDGPGVALRVRY
jgi:hypothetical protein